MTLIRMTLIRMTLIRMTLIRMTLIRMTHDVSCHFEGGIAVHFASVKTTLW
jgi:hypothetical protein